jgi:hypothetical protein
MLPIYRDCHRDTKDKIFDKIIQKESLTLTRTVIAFSSHGQLSNQLYKSMRSNLKSLIKLLVQ